MALFDRDTLHRMIARAFLNRIPGIVIAMQAADGLEALRQTP